MDTIYKYMLLPLTVLAMLAASCEKPAPEPEPEPEPEIQTIELLTPADGSAINLTEAEEVSFTWKKVDGINNYKMLVSIKDDMSNAYSVPALQLPLTFTSKEFDDIAEELGVEEEATASVYWSIVPFSARQEANSQVRRLEITRNSMAPIASSPIIYGKPLNQCVKEV